MYPVAIRHDNQKSWRLQEKTHPCFAEFYVIFFQQAMSKLNYHLVMADIAMENPHTKWWFIAGKIIYKWVIFHGYVK